MGFMDTFVIGNINFWCGLNSERPAVVDFDSWPSLSKVFWVLINSTLAKKKTLFTSLYIFFREK